MNSIESYEKGDLSLVGVPSAQGEFVSIRNLLVTSVVIFVQ